MPTMPKVLQNAESKYIPMGMVTRVDHAPYHAHHAHPGEGMEEVYLKIKNKAVGRTGVACLRETLPPIG